RRASRRRRSVLFRASRADYCPGGASLAARELFFARIRGPPVASSATPLASWTDIDSPASTAAGFCTVKSPPTCRSCSRSSCAPLPPPRRHPPASPVAAPDRRGHITTVSKQAKSWLRKRTYYYDCPV